MKVLLVEDDVAIAESVSASLSNAGMSVHHSATGAEAIEAAKEFSPEVILMDLGLPDMDCLDVSKSIREF